MAGVDPDLIIKPFSRKGAMRSVREFSVNAFSQHHGKQSVERFGGDTDPDQDGVVNELFIGDIAERVYFRKRCRFLYGRRLAQTAKLLSWDKNCSAKSDAQRAMSPHCN